MCNMGHFHTDAFGYLVNAPEIRALIEETAPCPPEDGVTGSE